jgi:F0F1-type ATP synthase membrane subunit b/b'
MESLVTSSFNFAILVGILGYKLRDPIKTYVTQRHHSIRNELQSVKEHLRQAQEKYDEFSAKLKAIDSEISILREQTKQETQALKQRVLVEARRIAGTLVSDAKNSASGAFADLRSQLSLELTHKVMDRAEQLLRDRVTGDDRVRIRQEFSRQVENIQ